MPGNLLDQPLLRLSKSDHFTVRDAVQGVAVLGGIGSGKTTGSGAALAGAYLRAGMGGLVLCAKPEEAELWRRYCAQHGRSASLVEWDGTTPGFNFLNYELARQGGDGINSVVETMMRVVEIAALASPMQSRAGEAFWIDTQRQVLRNTIPTLYAATGTVRVADILRFVRSAPIAPAQMADPNWQRSSFFFEMFQAARAYLDDATGERLVSYWRNDFATLDAKTRGNIVISLTTALDRFNHGWLAQAFCGPTTLVPELSFHGAILLLNMPALTRNEDGIIAQQLFKYMWQRSVLARNGLDPGQRARPVFLWADEAQYFVNSFDAEYQSTCRGSLACTVYLSQSLPTYYAKLGGDGGHDRVHHLLGNFATRIWHNNACAETNEWAAKTLGRTLQSRANTSHGEGTNSNYGLNLGDGTTWGSNSSSGSSYSGGPQGGSYGSSVSSGTSEGGHDNRGRNRGYGTNSSRSWGTSETMDYMIEPGEFARMLKTGGPAHGKRVSAIWFQAGRRFAASGGNALLAEFQQ
ncbi:type IV secretory system conjugative DNA transfer family protein [Blastomonas sp. CACIA14H2]|uniref:type IV secretory system conjugative DNA transfer family protein n=1 Tax=Blastomonas sp. CACIA14H2 TaxID=1419876 RepID=UPI000403B42C